jgi:NADH-quinone oxidoreductase subunit N
MPLEQWFLLSPLLALGLGGLLLMLLEVFLPEQQSRFLPGFTLATLGVSAALAAVTWLRYPGGYSQQILGGSVAVDNFGTFLTLLILGAAFCSVLMGWAYFPQEKMEHGEVYSLLLFAVAGMVALVSGTHLITLFVAVEVMSIAVYVLVGARRQSVTGNEAALKYFFLGSFASGLLLMGIALIYGMVGSVELHAIGHFLAHPEAGKLPLALVGVLLLFAGMGFKVAAVPFHAWAADVYQGAPTPITAFMATAVKTASFGFLIRVAGTAFLPAHAQWVDLVSVLAILTMTVGNALAFAQTEIKRMLAFSSVAHTGYLLMGIVALGGHGHSARAMLVYLATYVLSSLPLFAVLTAWSGPGEKRTRIEDLAGLGRSNPVFALVIGVSLASMMGLPPTVGFFGKFTLFSEVLAAGHGWLALIAILNSIASVAYYLRPILVMTMQEGTEAKPAAETDLPGFLRAALPVGAVAVALLTALPLVFDRLVGWAGHSTSGLF